MTLRLVNPTASTFVKPLRLYSVAFSGKRTRKTAMQLVLPLWDSSARTNAVTSSSYRWTRALRVPSLPMLVCVWWPEDLRNFVPHSTLGGVWAPKQCCRSPNLEEFNASPSRALLDWRDFRSELNAVQRHSTLDETGTVF